MAQHDRASSRVAHAENLKGDAVDVDEFGALKWIHSLTPIPDNPPPAHHGSSAAGSPLLDNSQARGGSMLKSYVLRFVYTNAEATG